MIDIVTASILLSSGLILSTVPVMIAGVLVAELLIALGLSRRIAFLARPVTRFSRLSHECGTAFMMAFVSPNAANAMLVDYYHHDVIERRELVIAALMNSFPAIVMHWRVLLPVYIPLLGVAGALYFLVLTAVGLLKTLLVMLAGRILLSGRPDAQPPGDRPAVVRPEHIPREVLRSAGKPIGRILLITIPTIFLVSLFMEAGLFDALAGSIEGVSGLFPIPVEGVGIIAAQFANYIAAASLASPLYLSGGISTRDLVLTLMVGNVLSSVTRTLRWFGPAYVGIFGPRLGTEVMLLSTFLRNGVMLIAIAVLAVLW